MITFAIVGHNEADTVTGVLNMTSAAATVGDHVLFVDSASTDATVAVARATGVEVLLGPIGKGAAMAVAVAAAKTDWICFLDADLIKADRNIPAVLRAAAVATPDRVGHIVGDFHDNGVGVLSNTIAVYEPLVAGLFPEVAGRHGSKPLSGFRMVRREAMPAGLPRDYGVEAYLNIELGMAGVDVTVVPIGLFIGKFKPHQTMGWELANAVLDAGERFGRLAPSARPAWERWVDEALTVVSVNKVADMDRDSYRARLHESARRPLPPATVDSPTT